MPAGVLRPGGVNTTRRPVLSVNATTKRGEHAVTHFALVAGSQSAVTVDSLAQLTGLTNASTTVCKQ
jgi:hypothetical protein